MEYESIIFEAFKGNNINKILLIDDAYDPPYIDDKAKASFLEFLNSDSGERFCRDSSVNEEERDAAINALNVGNVEDSNLSNLHTMLYEKYVETLESKFDPGECFSKFKESSLRPLKTLHAFLTNCGNSIQVRTAGFLIGEHRLIDFEPQILFIDCYLDSPESLRGSNDENTRIVARNSSIDLLKRIVKNHKDKLDTPAIVLMSSKSVNNVDDYRHEVDDEQLLALRFGFLDKNLINPEGSDTSIENEAVDVLLDISQGYLFGKELQNALNEWNDGLNKALKTFRSEIVDLHIKDYAYLLRFRLKDESQPLSEYLEWLFGEYLKGSIDAEVNWNHISFSNLDNQNLESSIDGAFDGPSERIARMYHQIKVNTRRSGKRNDYRFGDIYVNPKENKIRAVITPDCDLIIRKNKTKVTNILTMGGKLSDFDQRESFVDDVFIYNDNVKFLQWDRKDLETYPAKGKKSLKKIKGLKLVGTIRSLYALAMQRCVLTDVGRIALPVAPALGLNANIEAWIRKKGSGFERIGLTQNKVATIIPARTGQVAGHQVLLRREFFFELIDYLKKVELSSLVQNDAQKLKRLKATNVIKSQYKKFVEIGVNTNDKPKYGIGLKFESKPNRSNSAPWLQITIDVSEEIKNQIRVIDPLQGYD